MKDIHLALFNFKRVHVNSDRPCCVVVGAPLSGEAFCFDLPSATPLHGTLLVALRVGKSALSTCFWQTCIAQTHLAE